MTFRHAPLTGPGDGGSRGAGREHGIRSGQTNGVRSTPSSRPASQSPTENKKWIAQTKSTERTRFIVSEEMVLCSGNQKECDQEAVNSDGLKQNHAQNKVCEHGTRCTWITSDTGRGVTCRQTHTNA